VLQVYPGPSGIFIHCTDSLPKHFRWELSRSEAGGEFKVIAQLGFPSGIHEFKARLMAGCNSGIPFRIPEEKVLQVIWERLTQGTNTRVLGEYRTQPCFLTAAGCGYWDHEVKQGSNYRYKLRMLNTDGRRFRELRSQDISPGAVTAGITLQHSGTRVEAPGVALEFLVEKHERMQGCRVYRSPYLMNDYREIFPLITFVEKDRKKSMRVYDDAVHEKGQYTYRIVPYDFFGNQGKAVENLDVYVVDKSSLQATLTGLQAESAADQHAIRLSWDIGNPDGIVSIDIYRSRDYDGYYVRMASLPPASRSWLDYRAEAFVTYYYSVVLQTAYARSAPTARVSGMLDAMLANTLPPGNVSASREGDRVVIRWERSSDDTRAYYVYRSFSYLDEPVLLAGPVVSEGREVSYTDSLKDITETKAVYVYAVKDENESGSLSPLSARVAVHGAVRNLPVAMPLESRFDKGRVTILWPDYFSSHKGLAGFKLYRRTLDTDDRLVEDWTLLKGSPTAFGVNAFHDVTVTEGLRYLYTLEAVGVDGSSGLRSPAVAVYLPETLPMPPANVRALPGEGLIRLEWDPVLDPDIRSILIHRLDMQGNKLPLATLPASAGEYTDESTRAEETYYYFILTEDKEGRKCREAAAVSVHGR